MAETNRRQSLKDTFLPKKGVAFLVGWEDGETREGKLFLEEMFPEQIVGAKTRNFAARRRSNFSSSQAASADCLIFSPPLAYLLRSLPVANAFPFLSRTQARPENQYKLSSLFSSFLPSVCEHSCLQSTHSKEKED